MPGAASIPSTVANALSERQFQTQVIELEQRGWLEALTCCRQVEVHVWKPVDWPIIERILGRTHTREEAA